MKLPDRVSQRRTSTLARQFSTYLAVGIVNTLFTYALYLGLATLIPYPVAFTGSYAVGILISYFGNATLAFQSQYNWLKMARYASVQVTLFLLSLGGLIALVERFGIGPWLAPLLVSLAIAVTGFLLSLWAVREAARDLRERSDLPERAERPCERRLLRRFFF
jgi:putative flippase GtrA